jgi:phosphotransacetylase
LSGSQAAWASLNVDVLSAAKRTETVAMKGESGANVQRLVAAVKALPPTPTAAAHACDESSLAGALDAGERRAIVPILVRPRQKIMAAAAAAKLDLAPYEIVDAEQRRLATAQWVSLIRGGRAAMPMKGSLGTAELLGAVVKRLGARAPITLTSRACTVESRPASCTVAAVVASRRWKAAAWAG